MSELDMVRIGEQMRPSPQLLAARCETDSELREYIRAFREELGERQRQRASVKYNAAKANAEGMAS